MLMSRGCWNMECTRSVGLKSLTYQDQVFILFVPTALTSYSVVSSYADPFAPFPKNNIHMCLSIVRTD